MSAYMDSCCFIDVAKYSLGRKDSIENLEDKEGHVQSCIKMLEAAGRGYIRVLTGTLTISECTHLSGVVDDEVKRLFRSILSSGKVVRLVTDTVFIAERARDLKWVYNVHLRGADATHVASALESGCKEFITDDNKILKYAPELAKLGLKAIRADETRLLTKYLLDEASQSVSGVKIGSSQTSLFEASESSES